VVIAGFALSAALILHFILISPNQAVPVPQITVLHEQGANYGLPMRLEIPKLGVDAAIDYVGITSQGELGVPTGPANAGWYDLGPRPGEKGNAVIDGHFGYKNHIPAVFDNLHTLQKGDKLYVKDIKGITATFVVRELRTYGPADYAPAVFRSSDGKAHLNLITCEGTWNQTQKSFSNRLVVFADKKI
jgi:LPXTG-site transpeptidase (sortase) family protein